MKREDVIREVQSMIDAGKYQVAKRIVLLAREPAGTVRRVTQGGRGRVRWMMKQEEAARMVAEAVQRIELVDSTD